MSVKYTGVVGRKFNRDGSFRYFPGNTVVCKVNDQEDLVNTLKWVQGRLKTLPFSHKFSFLTPYSFHMTAIELVCEQDMIEKDDWPKLVSEKKLCSIDKFFHEEIRKIEHPDINMRFSKFQIPQRIDLEPATPEDERKLKNYRKEVARITGLNNYDEAYPFHISLCYLINPLTDEEKMQTQQLIREVDAVLRTKLNIIHVGKPLFTIFNDMSDFVPYERGRENLGIYKIIE